MTETISTITSDTATEGRQAMKGDMGNNGKPLTAGKIGAGLATAAVVGGLAFLALASARNDNPEQNNAPDAVATLAPDKPDATPTPRPTETRPATTDIVPPANEHNYTMEDLERMFPGNGPIDDYIRQHDYVIGIPHVVKLSGERLEDAVSLSFLGAPMSRDAFAILDHNANVHALFAKEGREVAGYVVYPNSWRFGDSETGQMAIQIGDGTNWVNVSFASRHAHAADWQNFITTHSVLSSNDAKLLITAGSVLFEYDEGESRRMMFAPGSLEVSSSIEAKQPPLASYDEWSERLGHLPLSGGLATVKEGLDTVRQLPEGSKRILNDHGAAVGMTEQGELATVVLAPNTYTIAKSVNQADDGTAHYSIWVSSGADEVRFEFRTVPEASALPEGIDGRPPVFNDYLVSINPGDNVILYNPNTEDRHVLAMVDGTFNVQARTFQNPDLDALFENTDSSPNIVPDAAKQGTSVQPTNRRIGRVTSNTNPRRSAEIARKHNHTPADDLVAYDELTRDANGMPLPGVDPGAFRSRAPRYS